MNLLIMGAPGAGKGTMSQLILDNYDVVHVSTGDMLRQAIKDEEPVGLKAQEYMTKGELVPDEIIHDIIVNRLGKDDIKNGFLFDGYPRTLAQAVDLDAILDELGLKLDLVVNLNIEDEVLTKRITGRRLCPSCGSIYNIYFTPSKKEGICDDCGSELSFRKDDNIDSLKVRLEEYHKNTTPVIKHYEEAGIVHHINADQDIEKVFADINMILGGK